MSVRIDVVQESDGTLILEIEQGDIQLYIEIDEADANDLAQDLQAILEERWGDRYGFDD